MAPSPLLAVLLALPGAPGAEAAAFIKGDKQHRAIYYSIDEAIKGGKPAEIRRAVRTYNDLFAGCVRFFELPTLDKKALADAADSIVQGKKAGYLRFQASTKCSEDCVGNRSEAGKDCKSGGFQKIYVAEKDCGEALLLHELGHKLGMIHEHSRPDRDDSVKVRTRNIHAGAKDEGYDPDYAFGVWPDPVSVHGGFDFSSIMIYGSCEFSRSQDKDDGTRCARGDEVLVKRDGARIARPVRLSAADSAALKKEYACAELKTPAAPAPSF